MKAGVRMEGSATGVPGLCVVDKNANLHEHQFLMLTVSREHHTLAYRQELID